MYYSITLKNISKLIPAIFEYFSCEEFGHNPAYPCDQSHYTHNIQYILTIFSHNTISLISVNILLFILHIEANIHADKKVRNVSSIADGICHYIMMYSY